MIDSIAPLPDCHDHEHPPRTTRQLAPSHALARAAALFRAAGDEARLRLLERLSQGEWCVSELSEAAGVGISTVSQQLRLLRGERLVTRRRNGKHIYYSLADEHVRSLIISALDHASEPHEDINEERERAP
jgi:ArsR family transcriptional regulator